MTFDAAPSLHATNLLIVESVFVCCARQISTKIESNKIILCVVGLVDNRKKFIQERQILQTIAKFNYSFREGSIRMADAICDEDGGDEDFLRSLCCSVVNALRLLFASIEALKVLTLLIGTVAIGSNE